MSFRVTEEHVASARATTMAHVPISFGPGTYHNVFDTDQDEAPAVAGNGTAGNYTVRGAPAPLRGNGKHIRRTPRKAPAICQYA